MELAFIRDLVQTKTTNLKRLVDRGISIGAATDAGVHMFLGILPEELCRMSRGGIPPVRALRSATVDAARILRIDDAGRIRSGFRADLVLYGDDPLADMEALKTPELVMRDGVPVLWKDTVG